MIMKITSKSGAAIAAAAATLFLAGMTMSTDAQAADGHCMGAPACKGQSACKGGKSPGPGANACKGMGFHDEQGRLRRGQGQVQAGLKTGRTPKIQGPRHCRGHALPDVS